MDYWVLQISNIKTEEHLSILIKIDYNNFFRKEYINILPWLCQHVHSSY